MPDIEQGPSLGLYHHWWLLPQFENYCGRILPRIYSCKRAFCSDNFTFQLQKNRWEFCNDNINFGVTKLAVILAAAKLVVTLTPKSNQWCQSLSCKYSLPQKREAVLSTDAKLILPLQNCLPFFAELCKYKVAECCKVQKSATANKALKMQASTLQLQIFADSETLDSCQRQ